MKDMKLPVTCHMPLVTLLWKTWNFLWHVPKKRCESFHIFEIKNFWVTKATFNNWKFMNNLAFIVKIRIHVCLLRDTWSLREVKGDNPLCGVCRYASPDSLWFLRISNLKQGIIFYLVGFVSLVWSLDRVTQVVMDSLLSFPFCGKKVILNTFGGIARSYEFYAHGICFIWGLHRKNLF